MRLPDAWHVDEIAHAAGSNSFSRSDRRVGGSNLSRIHRCYVDEWVRSKGGAIGILAGTTLSDHAPIILLLDDPSHQKCT